MPQGPADARIESPGATPERRRRLLLDVSFLLLATIIAAVWFGTLQFRTDAITEVDGYFHIKFSYLMAHGRGIIRKLPWLQYTIHRDYYRDHHFLFHLLLIPFTFGDLRLGAKLAAWIFPTLAMTVFYLVASRRGRLLALIATILLLGSSQQFVNRMLMPRVPALSMLFLLAGTLALLARRYRCLAAVMFLYVWLYDGFVLLLGMSLCFFLAELMVDGRANWRILAWAFGGMIAGIVVNPYFPHNVTSYLFNLARVTSEAQVAERTGVEWFPLDTWFLLKKALVVWLAFGIGTLLAILHRGVSAATLALFLASAAGMVLAFKARHHLDIWPEVALLFMVWAWADFWEEFRQRNPLRTWAPRLALAALALLVLLTPRAYLQEASYLSDSLRPFDYYRGAGEYLKKHVPPGTIVFTGSWDDFPYLFFFASDCYYVVGLDKLYMKRYDPELYDLWERITSGLVMSPSREIRERFHAKYVVVNLLEEQAFYLACHYDPDMEEVYSDPPREYAGLKGVRFCAVFKVLEPLSVTGSSGEPH